ncbi:restriction endonuclease-like protein [Neobacillus terrae]|uniref:restriction endonuclease-like protein n=1 Tax=Neobacillus terrae TaxID=3034837 RepID=UPI00140E0B6C|nr:restriction endonuclease-like protein [Neobacillus terrae]NHM30662.1 DUF2357 domain-containing protein [Neobacillus terrae]
MASLPSGSREDVELVVINSEDLSLVIKGKPYHQRYEGLKQYRAMDYHDVMEFSVHGKGTEEIKVFNVNSQELGDPGELRPIFFENGIYQIIVLPKNDRQLEFYHEHPLFRQAVSRVDIYPTYMLMGNLHFQNEVGYSTFEIRAGEQTLMAVTIEVFPAKLDYKNDYKKLLEEVNDEIYNLAFHFIRKTYLGAQIKLYGKPSRSEFYRLISTHFQHFVQALTRIERQPHHQLMTTHEKVRGDQLSKQDSRSRSYLQKRASLFVNVERGIAIQNRVLMPTEGLNIKKELTYDTLENRYIKWITQRLVNKLHDLKSTILSSRNRWEETPDQDLINRIDSMIKQLEGRAKNPFWKRIGKLDRSVMSLVLQMAPGYRDAFQIYLTVSKGLMLQGKLYQLSVKDVATLYEYWTFLKLGQILNKKYELLSQDIIKVNRDGLFVNLESNRTAQRIYRHPITKEKIVLTYQKYEKNPTIPQIPDTMLSIEKKGKDYTYNYIFDAKYRIDYAQEGSYYKTRYILPGPMEDDINTMHRYRDSLVVANNGPFERTAFGAYVLFPWFDEAVYQEHHFYKSIDKVNIGALPFLPNATNLVEQFIENLIEKSPEEIQKEGILPRGSLEDWQSSLDEKVLVGLVQNEDDYHLYKQRGFYQLSSKLLKKGWQEAKYLALYLKSGVTSYNGVSEYGKIKNVEVVKNGDEEEIRFEVEFWKRTPQLIRPVGYGIAVYAMSSLNILKEAQELPELFMKTKEEMTLWRMLRRVSDQIKLELNDENIDKASQINSFSFKNIKIELMKDREVIAISNEQEKIEISIELLSKQPSMVFKEIIHFIAYKGEA